MFAHEIGKGNISLTLNKKKANKNNDENVAIQMRNLKCEDTHLLLWKFSITSLEDANQTKRNKQNIN